HIVLADRDAFPGSSHGTAEACTCSRRIAKIRADRFFHLLAAVQQPEHDKQRHHRGDEIGVSDLPCPAVMPAVAAFLLDDVDGGRSLLALPPACAVAPPFDAPSNS